MPLQQTIKKVVFFSAYSQIDGWGYAVKRGEIDIVKINNGRWSVLYLSSLTIFSILGCSSSFAPLYPNSAISRGADSAGSCFSAGYTLYNGTCVSLASPASKGLSFCADGSNSLNCGVNGGYSSSCEIAVNSCPLHPEIAGARMDNVNGSNMDATHCMQRTQDYVNYCASSDPVTAAFYLNGQALYRQSSLPLIRGPCSGFVSPDHAIFVSTSGDSNADGTVLHPVTLDRAPQLASNLAHVLDAQGKSGPVCVYLRNGIYTRNQPVQFVHNSSVDQSGTATSPIVFAPYPGEAAALSGALSFSGSDCHWVTQTITSVSGAPIKAQKCVIPNSVSGLLQQAIQAKKAAGKNGGAFTLPVLYVNGARKIRARFPNINGDIDPSYFSVDAANPANSKPYLVLPKNGGWGNVGVQAFNSGSVEMVVNASWEQPRSLIAAAWDNGPSYGLYLPSLAKLGFTLPREPGETLFKGHLENSLAFLDSPGEWFLDENEMALYYMPEPYENIGEARFDIPITDTLIQLSGQQGTDLRYIGFDSITFSLTSWSYENGIGDSTSYRFLQSACGLSGVIDGEFAQDISITNNRFEHLGKNGISLGGNRISGCGGYLGAPGELERISILNNQFFDIGGSSVRLSNYASATSVFEISRNIVHSTGQVFQDASAIAVLSAAQALIQDNQVVNSPYTGIQAGWRAPNTSRALIVVKDNLIDNSMRSLLDGGGIYLPAEQGLVANNRVSRLGTNRTPGSAPMTYDYYAIGIYLDDNAIYWRTENNIAPSYLSKSVSNYRGTNQIPVMLNDEWPMFVQKTDTNPGPGLPLLFYLAEGGPLSYSPYWAYHYISLSDPATVPKWFPVPSSYTTLFGSACLIQISGNCTNHPELATAPSFFYDTWDGADRNPWRCSARAAEYSNYCGNSPKVTAYYLVNGQIQKSFTAN